MEPQSPEDVSRRGFLGRMIFGLGGLITAVLGGAGGAYFLSPAFKKEAEDWVDIGAVSAVTKGMPAKMEFVERKRDAWVTTERRSFAWVLTSNGKDFIAYDPRCTHLGCPYRWDSDKRQFICPCHTAVFDVDGRVVSGPPPRGLDRFPTKVVGGRLMIRPQPEKEKAA
jgi:menaquinol-cytochrome c reductase iron-sulfur subunit